MLDSYLPVRELTAGGIGSNASSLELSHASGAA
jgi:hypothetical protein